jgi:hypothetical protein
MQSANIAARTANSAKVRANNINIALMAISHQQFVPLQSENLFHDKSPSSLLGCQNRARDVRDCHHVLALLEKRPPNRQEKQFSRKRAFSGPKSWRYCTAAGDDGAVRAEH